MQKKYKTDEVREKQKKRERKLTQKNLFQLDMKNSWDQNFTPPAFAQHIKAQRQIMREKFVFFYPYRSTKAKHKEKMVGISGKTTLIRFAITVEKYKKKAHGFSSIMGF